MNIIRKISPMFAVALVVAACGSTPTGRIERIPTSTVAPISTPSTKASPSKTAKPPVKTTTKPPANDPRFDTCKEAIAHGFGPYLKGIDPEYAWYRDGDGDGMVCE